MPVTARQQEAGEELEDEGSRIDAEGERGGAPGPIGMVLCFLTPYKTTCK